MDADGTALRHIDDDMQQVIACDAEQQRAAGVVLGQQIPGLDAACGDHAVERCLDLLERAVSAWRRSTVACCAFRFATATPAWALLIAAVSPRNSPSCCRRSAWSPGLARPVLS